MKKLVLAAVLAVITVVASAQGSKVLRPRVEIAEVSAEDDTKVEMEVFYMNDENPRTYWLSLGHLGIGSDIVQMDIDPVYELFIPLGHTLDEAIVTLEQMKEFYKMEDLETTSVEGCFEIMYPTDETVTVTVTFRKYLLSKLLEFSLPTAGDGVVRATYVGKSKFRSIVNGVKFYKKLHPSE